MFKKTNALLLTAALCAVLASPVYAQSNGGGSGGSTGGGSTGTGNNSSNGSVNGSTNTGGGATTPTNQAGQSSGQTIGSGSDDGGKSSGGGAPLAGTYDETNVTPDAPMGTMDMSRSSSFTADQKTEATGRCRVVSKSPSKYKADVVEFCKGMM